jgi:glucokinase
MNRLAIAIDLGGTRIRAALIDGKGFLVQRAEAPTAADAGCEVVVGQLHHIATSVIAGVAPDRVVGVGICAPGPLDAERGVALATPTIAGFIDLPLAAMLEERIGLPVRLENDGIAAALGEWRFGAGVGHRNLVYVTVSTGVGGGVVADGRVLRARRGMAGHVGHMTIVRDGEVCSCGNRGCWEAYASGTAFARRARLRAVSSPSTALGMNGAAIDGRAVFDAASRGDALARDLVSEEADLLGVGIVNLLHLYSPDVVVVGGGLSNGFDLLHPGIVARIKSAAMPPFRDTPVVRAGLGSDSGLLGASTLAFEAALSSFSTPPRVETDAL